MEKTIKSKVLMLAMVLMFLTLIFGVTFAFKTAAYADSVVEAPKCSVVAHGGVINNIASKWTVDSGKVVSIKLDEKKWGKYTFEHWRSDDGTIIPKKEFRTLVERDTAFYPVFSDLKGNFGEWSVYKKGEFCVNDSIYVREDKAKGLKEFRRERGESSHSYDYTEIDNNYHLKSCSLCSYSEKEAHNFDDGKVVVEATHTKEGEKAFTCRNCGAVKTEPIAKTTEHTFPYKPQDSDYEIVEEAKDGNVGKRRLKCSANDGYLAAEQEYVVAELPKSTGKVQRYLLERTSGYSGGLSLARIEEHYISDNAHYYAVTRSSIGSGFALLWFDKGKNSPVYIKSGKFDRAPQINTHVAPTFNTNSYYGSSESDYYGILTYVDSHQEFIDFITHWSHIHTYDNGRSVSNFYFDSASGYKYYANLFNDGKKEQLTLKTENVNFFGWEKPLKVYEYIYGGKTQTMYVDDRNVCVKYGDGVENAEIKYSEVDAFPFSEPDRTKVTHFSYHITDGYCGYSYDSSFFGMTSYETNDEDRIAKHNTPTADKVFSHWEKMNPYTKKWEYCTDKETWTPSVTDVTMLHAVFKDKTVHIKVNGGYFKIDEGWYDWSVKQYSDDDVKYNARISLFADSKLTPEGKQFARFVDASGNTVSGVISSQSDAEYTAIYEDKTSYFYAEAENGVVKKDGEIFTGGQFLVGSKVTFTTESSDATAYPNFLGWCDVGWVNGVKVYTLVSKNKTYTTTVSDNSSENRITAVWSDQKSLPEFKINYHSIEVVNGLVRTQYDGVAVSYALSPSDSTVSAIGDPSVKRELKKWTLTDAKGDGAVIEEQVYNAHGNTFYISGGDDGKGGKGGKGKPSGMPSSPTNIKITGYFPTYCVHTCEKCGCCTLPSTDTSCDYKKCTCTETDKSTLITTTANDVVSVKVEGNESVNGAAYAVNVAQNATNEYVQNVLLATSNFVVEQVYDVALVDADGKPYDLQNGETATVTLTVGTDNANAINEGEMFVAHITANGVDIYGNGYMPNNVNAKDGTVTVSTDEFSPFVLVSPKNVTISFAANGGNGDMASQSIKSGKSFSLPSNKFTAPKGKKFKGWSVSTDGEALQASSYVMNDDVTLYAVWEDATNDISQGGLSGGAIAGIVISVVIVLGLGGFAIFWFAIKKKTFADLIAAMKINNRKRR